MTKEQLLLLTRILELVRQLLDDTDTPDAPDLTHVEALLRQHALVDAAIGELITDLEAKNNAKMDCTVLKAVRRRLTDEVATPLAAAKARPATADYQGLELVCRSEWAALDLLAKAAPQLDAPVAAEGYPPLGVKLAMMRKCVVKNDKIYVDTDKAGLAEDKRSAAHTLGGLSLALVRLRNEGIVAIEFVNMLNTTALQRSWLCHAARRVFTYEERRLGVTVNLVVSVPGQQAVLFAHLIFSLDGVCRIEFEGTAFSPGYTSTLSVADTKAQMVQHFTLKDIIEQGGAQWTLEELLQVHNALSKIPQPDRKALEGCLLIRQKVSKDPEANAECGSYEPFAHSITLLDAVFPPTVFGFVGAAGNIRPYADWVIVHEVGHAVEMLHWRTELKKFDHRPLDTKIAELEAARNRLGTLLHKTGTSMPEAQYNQTKQEYDDLTQQLIEPAKQREALGYTYDRMMADRAGNQPEPNFCLHSFAKRVEELRVPAFTLYAHECWKTKKHEYFADAYALFRNDPDVLTQISPDLFNWFATGKYRDWPQ